MMETTSFSMNPYMLAMIVGGLVIAAYFIGRSSVTNTIATSEKPKMKRMDVSDVMNDPEFIAALERNQKINAIKIMREHTGMGLKDSKDEVERIVTERGY